MKKSFPLVGLIIFLVLSVHVPSVLAKSSYVADCLQNNTKCEQLDRSTETSNHNEDKQAKQSAAKSTTSLTFSFIRMIVALLFILFLIYVLLKFLNKRNKLFSQVKALDNVGGISLGQNKSIQVVRVGTKLYMVGVGDNVQLLEEITDEGTKESILHSHVDDGDSKKTWISTLFPSQNLSEKNQGSQKFKQLFATELDKLKIGRKKMMEQRQKDDTHE